ncbi:MAG: hypothetical protein EOO38_20705 [Cytophagaceae bacterium]|nr:MAG: hypothetical protein EOO38_20705 [Cytophagaceae bacterium]
MLLLAAVSLMLAWVTWYWIEQPFRRKTRPVIASRRGVFTLGASVGAMLLASGLFGVFSKRFEMSLDAKLVRYVEAVEDRASDACNFDLNRPADFHPQPQCLSNGAPAIDVLLIGDSHMWSISDEVRSELDKRNISYYSVSHTSCLPLFGFKIHDGPIVVECEDFLRGAFSWATQNDVSTVVLAARFPLYLYGSRFDNGEGGVESGVDGWADLTDVQTSNSDDAKRRKRVLLAYESRLRSLAEEFSIVLVYPIPEAGWDVPSYGFKNARFNGTDGSLSTSDEAYVARTKEVNSLFDRLVTELPNVFAARVYEIFCKEGTGRCINADSGGVYYYDDDHLSNAGARLIAPLIVDSVEASLRGESILGEE